MKLRLLTLIALSVLLLSNSGGINAPRSGAPGDGISTCNQCHSGGNYNPEVQVVLKDEDGNIAEEYAPDTKYTLEVVGSNNGANSPNLYGFQLTVLDTTTNNKAGQFGALGNDVRLLTIMDRDYIMQSKPRPDGVFTAEWTSPAQETGSVEVYIALLAANGNGNTSGDRVVSSSFRFDEAITSNTSDFETAKLAVYPTITSDHISIQNAGTYNIIDISGRPIITNQSVTDLDVSFLPKGTYFVVSEKRTTKQFVKI